jgi:hypothetical protein
MLEETIHVHVHVCVCVTLRMRIVCMVCTLHVLVQKQWKYYFGMNLMI